MCTRSWKATARRSNLANSRNSCELFLSKLFKKSEKQELKKNEFFLLVLKTRCLFLLVFFNYNFITSNTNAKLHNLNIHKHNGQQNN